MDCITSSPCGWTLLLLSITFTWSIVGVRGLHNLEIKVPNSVLLGETVTLECSWQLEDEEILYSVKWYKGRDEFYRYIPKELPHTRVFPLPGIEVDISRSGARRVVLQNAVPTTAGRYRCEASADAPTFHTAIHSAILEVVVPPEWHLKLTTDKSWYGIGHVMRASCASPPSLPAANITITVNGKEIKTTSLEHKLPEEFKWDPLPKNETTEDPTFDMTNDDSIQYLDASYVSLHENEIKRPRKEVLSIDVNNLSRKQPSIVRAEYKVKAESFERGVLKLSCLSRIYNVYADHVEIVFDMEQPEVASVLGVGVRNAASGAKSYRAWQWITLLSLTFYSLMIYQ